MKSYLWFTFKHVLNIDDDLLVSMLISNYNRMPLVFTPQERRRLTQLGVPINKKNIVNKRDFESWCREMTRKTLPKIKNNTFVKLKRGKL